MSRPLRIVFMGTPAFAVESLRACADLGEVVAVVTQPDKPRGRGQAVSYSPVKEEALARGYPVLQPEKVRTPPFAPILAELKPDVAVVTAYGKILPQEVLDVPVHGCVNVHASLLPRFRGAAPIQWALASGDAETGVCLMRMDAGMDTGDVIARRVLPIEDTDTSATLHDKLAVLGGQALREALPEYVAGRLAPVPQPDEGVVMAPMIRKQDGFLDFNRSARELERRMRAFTPWPGSYTRLEGALLKVHAARVQAGAGQPGEVIAAGPEGIEVACGEGSLLLLQVQPEGKRVMDAAGFLAGRKLPVGTRFPLELPTE